MIFNDLNGAYYFIEFYETTNKASKKEFQVRFNSGLRKRTRLSVVHTKAEDLKCELI
jgi:hypothetical protein